VHGRTHVWDQQRSEALEVQILATPDQQLLLTPA
jgi:hypothetical protein